MKTLTEYWNYNSFSNFMEIIGYDDDNHISKNYIKILKYIIENESDGNKKITAENLLKEFKNNRKTIPVKLIFKIYSFYKYTVNNDDFKHAIYWLHIWCTSGS